MYQHAVWTWHCTELIEPGKLQHLAGFEIAACRKSGWRGTGRRPAASRGCGRGAGSHCGLEQERRSSVRRGVGGLGDQGTLARMLRTDFVRNCITWEICMTWSHTEHITHRPPFHVYCPLWWYGVKLLSDATKKQQHRNVPFSSHHLLLNQESLHVWTLLSVLQFRL